MQLKRLEVTNFRCLRAVEVALPSQGAWFVGRNGAGKTSILEAACLLGFGRSFRGRVADGLIRQGNSDLQVVAHWVDDTTRSRVAGLRHAGESWEGRLDGAAVSTLSELAAPFPVLVFHPESSGLVTGPAEERRRALDWLAFHVEHRFSEVSRRYGRAQKQRNALLRAGAPDDQFDAWESEMGAMAEALSAARESALGVLRPSFETAWVELMPDSQAPEIALRPGWRRSESNLADLLLLNRTRDRELGYTTVGPHRADVDLGEPLGVAASLLSRGQAKLVALCLVMAQAEALRRWSGIRAVLLLDDLRAELDFERFRRVLEWIGRHGYQALISGTALDPDASERLPEMAVFHVEQGELMALQDPPVEPGPAL